MSGLDSRGVTRQLLRNCLLLDPEAELPTPGCLLLEDGRIAARLGPGEDRPADAEPLDLGGKAVAPGFLDLHFHGSMIFHEAAGLRAALASDSASLLRHGTTSFLTTTIAWPGAELTSRVTELAAALGDPDGPWPGARPLGLHLEGPWINPEAAGAQPGPGVRDFEASEAEDLLARAEGLIRMVTLAPEIAGAAILQELLAQRGIVTALGHSLAEAAEAERAIERGASHVTHLFNAMGALHHREPGLAGLALSDERLTCDLICDGAHVDPRVVWLAARAKREQLVLISDRVDPPPADAAPLGMGSGALHDDGVALRLADGQLAGSRVTLDRALRNIRDFAGLTRLEAVAACSLRPARVLGLESEVGTLRVGARADLAVLNEADQVVETWIDGRRVLARDAPPAAPDSAAA